VDTAAANSASAVVLRLEVAVPAALPRCHHASAIAAVAGQVALHGAGHAGRAVVLLGLLVARGGG